YLCFSQPEYYDKLSDASKTTLKYQGGIMSLEEACAFESDPCHQIYVLMRQWDEQAKVPGKQVPSLESYMALVDVMTAAVSAEALPDVYILSTPQREFWMNNGYLKLPNFMNFHGIDPASLGDWVNEIAGWEKTDDKWLLHWEAVGTEEVRTLCRAENFAHYHN
ncbi:unnamed protein product, partial [Symbiodinium microadriaticum]